MKLKQVKTKSKKIAGRIAEEVVRDLERDPKSKNWSYISMEDVDINKNVRRLFYNEKSRYILRYHDNNCKSLDFDASKQYELTFSDNIKISGWVDFELIVYGNPKSLRFGITSELRSQDEKEKSGRFVEGTPTELADSLYSDGLRVGSKYSLNHCFIEEGGIFLPNVSKIEAKKVKINPMLLSLFIEQIKDRYDLLKWHEEQGNKQVKERDYVDDCYWSLDKVLKFLESEGRCSLKPDKLISIRKGINSCAWKLASNGKVNIYGYFAASDLIERTLREKMYHTADKYGSKG